MVRPPTRPLKLDDFEAAEMGIASPSTNTTKIIIVSAMFPLEKSKHSKHEYKAWLKNFLAPITTDIYMYTTPELAEMLQEFRGNLPIVVNTSYASPFEIPPLRGLQETYTRMNDVDKEKWHHSPGLYAIWNSKPFLLHSAVQQLEQQGKSYDYAFWSDAGSFRREHYYTNWPDPGRVQQVWEEGSRLTGTKKEELLFFPIFDLPNNSFKNWKVNMGPLANPVQFSEGSFFGGSPLTVAWFSEKFYEYHDYYLYHWLFVGIDQDVFNALFLLFPERIFTVWMNDPDSPAHDGITPSPSLKPSLESGFLGECGPEWFYYQFWLANRENRDQMRTLWIEEERWRRLGWWAERKLCRMTRASSMTSLLKETFGTEWTKPSGLVSKLSFV
uniref:Uncharacterized protein n=1 Tax=Psilocybe cubensis TaxID=181762 RepID=A0A8H8CFD6_PSICU